MASAKEYQVFLLLIHKLHKEKMISDEGRFELKSKLKINSLRNAYS